MSSHFTKNKKGTKFRTLYLSSLCNYMLSRIILPLAQQQQLDQQRGLKLQ